MGNARSRLLLALVLSFGVALAGCAEDAAPPAATTPGTGGGGTPAGGGDDFDGGAANLDCDAAPSDAPTPTLARIHTSMGVITAQLAVEGAPNTSRNFIDLAASDFYDGVLFHRVIGPAKAPPAGFMIQTGDPTTKEGDATKDRWGTGGSEPIPDEFHPDLQHDGPGILSMANRGPDTGSSQFFITLAPTRHLDDKHAVFGRVVEGMDVVRAIGAVDTDAQDRPHENVAITDVEIVEAPVERGVAARGVLTDKTVGAGRAAQFLVLGTNAGNALDRLSFEADVPEGWSASFDVPCVDVIPGAGRISILRVTPPASFTGVQEIPVTVAGGGDASANATLRLTVGEVGEEVARGDSVKANYVGLLENGRLFDTSIGEIGQDESLPKSSSFRARAGAPFTFEVGGGVIEGFSKLATGAREGETPAGRIPPEDAYGPAGGGHPLSGKTLIFELQVLEVS